MNKNYKRFFKILAILGLVAGLASSALANDFSADMVSKYGNETTTAKIYVSGSKTRMEMTEGVMLIDSEQKVTWMLMPSDKMYMKHPFNAARNPRTSSSFNNETERTSLGMETVDGQQAEKFKVTYTDNGTTETVYQWLVNNTVLVKIAAVDGSWSTEYKNVSTGPQPAELFAIPADYTEMSMPSLGNMMQGMGIGQ